MHSTRTSSYDAARPIWFTGPTLGPAPQNPASQRAPPRQLEILQVRRRRSVFADLTFATQPCAIILLSHARTLLPASVLRTLPAAQSARIVAPAWQLQTMSCNCQSDSSKKRLASP